MIRPRARSLAAGLALAAGNALVPVAAAADGALPPSPYALTGRARLAPPPLDPLAPCVPAELPPVVAEAGRLLRAGRLDEARRAASIAQSSDPTPPDALLLATIAAARLASSETDVDAAATALGALRDPGAPPAWRFCVELERARAELRRGRFDVSAAAAARARDAAGENEAAKSAALFARAEALHHASWTRESQTLYEQLGRGAEPRLAAAARLRLADQQLEREPASAHAVYEALLERGPTFGASPRAFSAHAAEAALAAGDLAAARRRLEEAAQDDPGSEPAAAAQIRLGDSWLVSGDAARALTLYRRVLDRHGGTPMATVARLRMASLQPERAARSAEAREELRRVVADAGPALAAYAASLLANALVAAGEVEEALVVLASAVAQPAPADVAALLSESFHTASLAAATPAGDDGCTGVVRRMSGRRALLFAHARVAEPFLTLAACYTRVGLPNEALAVYRQVARVFGEGQADELALRVAEAALAARQHGLVRRIAEIAGAADSSLRWQLVRAEADLADGQNEAAAATLGALVRDAGSDAARERAVLLLARACAAQAQPTASCDPLDGGLTSWAAHARGKPDALFGEAALLTATAHRRAGRNAQASDRYALALSALPPGPLRAEAGYWRSRSSSDSVAGALALEEAATASSGGWSRLARNAVEIARLRDVIADQVAPPSPTAAAATATPAATSAAASPAPVEARPPDLPDLPDAPAAPDAKDAPAAPDPGAVGADTGAPAAAAIAAAEDEDEIEPPPLGSKPAKPAQAAKPARPAQSAKSAKAGKPSRGRSRR